MTDVEQRLRDIARCIIPLRREVSIHAFMVSLLFIIGSIALAMIIPDHIPSGVENLSGRNSSSSPDNIFLAPFLKWDSIFYLNIAANGYTVEKEIAFFPLYPFTLRILADVMYEFGITLDITKRLIISGILLNCICCIVTANILFAMFSKMRVEFNHCKLATLCYLLSPGSIFFHVIYTEQLYSFLTFFA